MTRQVLYDEAGGKGAMSQAQQGSGTAEAGLLPVQDAGSSARMLQAAQRDLYRHRVLRWARLYGSLSALIALVIVASILSPNFLTQSNIRLQLQSFCLTTALLCVGQTLVILTGGIDLSVGALLAVGSSLAGLMLTRDWTIPWIFVLPILLTTALGAASGTVIARARIQPIVVTLAMLIATRGLAQLLASDATIDLSNYDRFDTIATTQVGDLPIVGPIPISVIIAAVVYVVAALFLAHTVVGRYVFAVGGNERAARLSGVSADRVKIAVYAISGALAGLAGVLTASFNQTSDPFNDGNLFELTTIAAVVVGGSSLLGGIGSVWRTLVGGLILTVLFALFVQAGWPTQIQLIAQGLIIAGAVILQGGGNA